ncbi:YafY family transcriptional regulator [Phragmitibacter flavus]|uniref:YafY family transcriptional regulator n=1 Tax=Phragmitibacter flavus TaxID=2576071 RepID=A0A5R8KHH3_9BACT|nr:YafY family protein [Phragmitibacter flavus]TLD71766.1 YafY family transcriptional regulator [Phragmitibacter flavus]
MNRIDRLTGMILLLQGQRVITAEQVAAHFEISVRTVYRDLAALGEAGVPIVAEAGVGYSLMKGYHVPPVMFTEDEAAALFLSGEVTEQVADESLRGALRSALLKVKSVMPRERREYLNRLKHVVQVGQGARSQRREDEHRALMPLQQAVVRRQEVELRYDAGGRGEISSRTVEPLGLTFYGHHWHLVAFCRLRKDFRDFRLDRMVGWEVMPQCFAGHEEFSLKEFLKSVLEGLDTLPVTVVFERQVMDRVYREMPGTPLQVVEIRGGRVQVEMLTYSLEWTVGWLLSFGRGMEVVGPLGLRESVREVAQSMAEGHEPVDEKILIHS